MTASIHYLPPGHGPARRALEDAKTPPAVRAVCADMLNEDLTPKTRRLTPEELAEVFVAPAQFRCEPVGLGPMHRVHPIVWFIIPVMFGLAAYGAVKLGGDIVRMMLGVHP